jgi:hypothetical protein
MGQPIQRSGTEPRYGPTDSERPQRPAPLALPLPALPRPTRTATAYYVISTTDRRGRLADQSPLRALRWSAGRKVRIAAAGDAIVVTADPDGGEFITGQGFLRLPTALRHRYRIRNRDRLLMCTFVDRACLAVYTMAVMDEVFAARHAVWSDQIAS